MKLPDWARVRFTRADETHIHITLVVDTKMLNVDELAEIVRRELVRRPRRGSVGLQ